VPLSPPGCPIRVNFKIHIALEKAAAAAGHLFFSLPDTPRESFFIAWTVRWA